MNFNDLTEYKYEPPEFDFSQLFDIEQSVNNNNSVNTFFNLNDGVSVDGITQIKSVNVKEYVCKNNEHLRIISFNEYGTSQFWWLIAKINGIEDCMEELKPGQIIYLLPYGFMVHIFNEILKNKLTS